jgi:hypothetical protein
MHLEPQDLRGVKARLALEAVRERKTVGELAGQFATLAARTHNPCEGRNNRRQILMLMAILAGAADLRAGEPASPPPALYPVIEVEEEVYQYQPANNGAGPFWCSGSTCLVRIGEEERRR